MGNREIRRREAKRRKREDSPDFVEVPSHDWPVNQMRGLSRVYKNNQFIVLVFDRVLDRNGYRASKVMVQNNLNLPVGWKSLQTIKNQIFGREATGVQYLPPESELVDEANMYWFYVREKPVNDNALSS